MNLVEKIKQQSMSLVIAGGLGLVGGCATGNPGVDALGNWAGAMAVADAGRSTVIVNGQQAPAPAALRQWKLFTAEYAEGFPNSAVRGVKSNFPVDEPIYVAGNNGPIGPGSSKYLLLEVYDERGKKIAMKEKDNRAHPLVENLSLVEIYLSLPRNTLAPGTYEYSLSNQRGFLEKSSFKVLPK